MYLFELDQKKAEATVSFIKDESHKLYLAAKNIILFVPGLIGLVIADKLEDIPGESSMGPHINKYPQKKSKQQ